MFSYGTTRKTVAYLFFLCVVSTVPALHAAMDLRFELDPSALGASPAKVKPPSKSAKHRPHGRARRNQEGTTYVIKRGDNLHKILARDYGFSDDEAEIAIKEICRENNIHDIRRLKVGQRIVIPAAMRDGSVSQRTREPAGEIALATGGVASPLSGRAPNSGTPAHAVTSEQDTLRQIKGIWDRLIPAGSRQRRPLTVASPSFSLTLDLERYPLYATMDGGLMLVDPKNSIPPLVRGLIEEKEPTVRILSEPMTGSRGILAAMISAAGFYSVEEDFSVEFGTDPKLTVDTDFKIEKTSDSILNQDVVLVNTGRQALPPSLNGFLKKKGFTVYQTSVVARPAVAPTPSGIKQITTTRQSEVVDAVLKVLGVSPARGRSVDVFAADDIGISLSVKTDRTFTRNGRNVVISSFDGDPVTYTLFRILETKGYRVVMLEKQDGFQKTTEKLLSALDIKAEYRQHDLFQEEHPPLSLQMSGFWLEDPSLPGGSLFLTDLELDRTIRSVLAETGYNVSTN